MFFFHLSHNTPLPKPLKGFPLHLEQNPKRLSLAFKPLINLFPVYFSKHVVYHSPSPSLSSSHMVFLFLPQTCWDLCSRSLRALWAQYVPSLDLYGSPLLISLRTSSSQRDLPWSHRKIPSIPNTGIVPWQGSLYHNILLCFSSNPLSLIEIISFSVCLFIFHAFF